MKSCEKPVRSCMHHRTMRSCFRTSLLRPFLFCRPTPSLDRRVFFSDSNKYPKSPRVATAVTLLCCEGPKTVPRVLLAKRGKEPHKGKWSLPGGSVKLGETVVEAAVREMEEETGLQVVPAANVVTTSDSIHREATADGDSKVQYHYLIAQVVATLPLKGVPSVSARSDVDALEWVPLSDLADIANLSDDQVIATVVSGVEHLLMKEESIEADLYASCFSWFSQVVDTTAEQVRTARS